MAEHPHDHKDRLALDFIQRYINDNGYPPSRREVTEAIGAVSPSEGQNAVQRLIDKGLITVNPGVNRSIRVVMKEGDELL